MLILSLQLAPFMVLYLLAENFMTGYRIIFDRENMILGWKNTSCKYILVSIWHPLFFHLHELFLIPMRYGFPGYDGEVTNLSPISPAVSPSNSPAISPAMAVNPEPSSSISNQSEIVRPQTPNYSPKMKPFALSFLMVLVPLLIKF